MSKSITADTPVALEAPRKPHGERCGSDDVRRSEAISVQEVGIQHHFLQCFIQAVDPSTADNHCPAPTVEVYSLYSALQHVTALQRIQLYSALQSTASTAALWCDVFYVGLTPRASFSDNK